MTLFKAYQCIKLCKQFPVIDRAGDLMLVTKISLIDG